MPELIVFPDVEELLTEYLPSKLAELGYDVPVSTAIPVKRPDTFVTVPRRGGTARNLVSDQATIGVECWSTSPKAAYELCQVVRAVIRALRGTSDLGVPVYRIQEYNGPTNLPDSVSTHARYTYTVVIQVRGHAL